MSKRFIYTSYGAIMDTSKTAEEGQMIFDAELEGIGEMCNLLNKQNEEIERLKEHKQVDCKIIQEQSDLIDTLQAQIKHLEANLEAKTQYLDDVVEADKINYSKLHKALKYACEAVFDETLPYEEIDEMKQKYGKHTVGIILEDVLFYYEKLAEEELKNGN